jgi:hypothetical protein
MKSEFITHTSQIDIQRNLRRINATLIRMIPKRFRDHQGEIEAYLVLYVDNF